MLKQRVGKIEDTVTAIGMDMSYMRAKIEDAPTKDWVNSRLNGHTAILLAVMTLGFTVLGFIVALS